MSNVLVTGGTGMIGRYLVELLVRDSHNVTVASLDGQELCHPNAKFKQLDLRDINNCIEACEEIEEVYHLAGVKGSPKMCREQPADFFVPTITFSLNMMEAARRAGVKKYLYTSSVGVYHPAEIFKEDDVWSTFPSENDRFAGWAKRMGELQADAYRIQYQNSSSIYSIVRPGNVYGRYDNFDPENAMVIPSLIARLYKGENPLKVWGDGCPIRDFVHASDVARAMKYVMDNNIQEPVNVSSGNPTTIKNVVEEVIRNFHNVSYEFTESTFQGDNKRLMDVSRLKSKGWNPLITLEDGIADTVKWFKEEGYLGYKRYNSFKESK
ncbi:MULTISPECIES: NAD-dependent epimerase/dehydratase family protein [unclassified Prochlorococcus]|uniref:NAD-dependent epimerase/dehydratase family protein n=1 Tax=unclassified Prochlorococcus TaxID=2627481 RepID=UPI000533B86B|nr:MULTISPECIES: NAD-dependent epimerase/dehydratase family protein [unclassified Prochlorococcus]KGG16333.1 UDP-glucose 4-epimerase [Prochlorococcus sp. MIT 0603]KGG17933.1 UDP-glucose 4-epimerase [Prochlorococcus sp. MIT 0602]